MGADSDYDDSDCDGDVTALGCDVRCEFGVRDAPKLKARPN